MNRDYHYSFPVKFLLEIKTFEAGDPSYKIIMPDGRSGPGGFSVKIFLEQLNRHQGELTGPYGEKYRVDPTSWLGLDPDKTLLKIQYSLIPDYPYYIDPVLSGVSHQLPPVTSDKSHTSNVETASNNLPGENDAPPKKINRRIHYTGDYPAYIMCSDVRREHRLIIRPARPGKGFPASELLDLPIAASSEITCPVCEASVNIFEPLTKHIKDIASEFEQGEATLLEIIMDHPAHLPETKTPPPYLEVDRYHRFMPFSQPPVPSPEDAERWIELKSHDHWLRIRPGRAGETGGRTTAEWLNSEWVDRTELICPLCEAVLSSSGSLKEFVQVLADLEGSDKILEWSISHPLETAATAQIPADFPFKMLTHPIDSGRRVWEDHPGFALMAKQA